MAGKKKTLVKHCMGIDLCGEVGEICNNKRKKQKQNKGVIDLNDFSAWNAPCVAKGECINK